MKSALLLLGLLCLASPAPAQEAPQPLTLEEAKRIAAEKNPNYRQAQNNVETARAGERRGAMAFLPELQLNFSSGGYLSRILTGEDEFGKPVRRDDPLNLTGSSSSQQISLGSLTLFDGGARYRDLKAARADADATDAAVLQGAATLEAELARRYYDAKRKGELIRLEEELLTSADARQAATERLLRIASASPVDLLGAEVAVAEQARVLESARGEARKAVLALAEEMGVSDAPLWDLTSEPPPVFDPTTLDADSLAARALESSPLLAQLDARAVAGEQRSRAAGATRWPTVRASAGFGRSVGSEGYGSFFDPNPLNQSMSFNVSVSVPVFTGYRTTQSVTQARVAAMNAREEVQAARLTLEREVRGALIDLENAYRTVQLAERGRDLARRRLELANQQFRIGALKYVDLEGVIEQAADAERVAINARYDFAAARATLEEKASTSF
jgi:outer membrane protein TolC